MLNHGLHYASCVFEGVRVYEGRIFRNTEHNARLHTSGEMLGFKLPYPIPELDKACEETVCANNIRNGYLRPFAWRGSEQMAILTNRSSIHMAIAAWEWPSYFGAEALEKGLKLTFAKWKRPSPETEPVHSKAAGLYMICTLSKNAAVEAGYDDALMLDYRGYLAEATGANLFLVMGSELHTPTPDCFLNGITRQTVMELARKRGIKVVERHIKPEELADAQEVFVTGTAAEITPVGSVDTHTFTVGAVTKQLMEDFKVLTRGEPGSTKKKQAGV